MCSDLNTKLDIQKHGELFAMGVEKSGDEHITASSNQDKRYQHMYMLTLHSIKWQNIVKSYQKLINITSTGPKTHPKTCFTLKLSPWSL